MTKKKKTYKQHKGTQACIDHILAKRDKIKAREEYTPADNRVITMLGAIADELKQFL